MATTDFDRDGKLDLVVTSSVIDRFRGGGDGTFTALTPVNPGFFSYVVRAGDFNGDGYPDLALLDWFRGDVHVVLNDGTGGFPSSVTERQMFEQFHSFLADIGNPPEKVRPLTFATYGDYARAYSNREVMLITSWWTMDYPDAQNTMQLFYGPNAAPGANIANYRNAEFDRLYQTRAPMPPSPLRTALYQKMNRLVVDDCATISGVSRTLLLLWDRRWSMLPDSSFVGGYFFRFAAPAALPDGGAGAPR